MMTMMIMLLLMNDADDEDGDDDEDADDMDDGRFCVPRRRNIAPDTCRTMLEKLGSLFSRHSKTSSRIPNMQRITPGTCRMMLVKRGMQKLPFFVLF